MTNQDIIRNLNILSIYYEDIDYYRYQAYKNAIVAIKNLPFQITNIQQISGKNKVKYLGKSIVSKIEEYLSKGYMQEIKDLKEGLNIKNKVVYEPEKLEVIEEFKKIWGVGPKKAEELWDSGFRNIQDIKQNPQFLNRNQLVGLKYYDHLQEKIPRDEITIFQMAIRYLLNKTFGINSYTMIVAGSYRRRKEFSNDIDILITTVNFTLQQMVSTLTKYKVITDVLGMRKEKFMGIAHCPTSEKYHRMDIEFLPESEFGSGLLYFTGSKEFNIEMRNIAKDLGYTLNEHGLFSSRTLRRIPVYTEEEIFNVLNIKYVEPEKR